MLHQSAAHVVGTIPRIAAEALQQADDEARKREGLGPAQSWPSRLPMGAWTRVERRRIGPVMQALERLAGLSLDAP